MRKIILLAIVFLLSACSAAPATTVAPSLTATKVSTTTPVPSSTPTLTPTKTPLPTSTSTPTATMTPTAIPEELKNQILEAYNILLFIQIDANLLQETATRVSTGELSATESMGALLVVAVLVGAVDETIPGITPPDELQTEWDKAVEIHNQTKDILTRWFNDEIDSAAVLEEIKNPIADIETILSSADEKLAEFYGFDAQELQKVREDAIATINEILNTPTPTP